MSDVRKCSMCGVQHDPEYPNVDTETAICDRCAHDSVVSLRQQLADAQRERDAAKADAAEWELEHTAARADEKRMREQRDSAHSRLISYIEKHLVLVADADAMRAVLEDTLSAYGKYGDVPASILERIENLLECES